MDDGPSPQRPAHAGDRAGGMGGGRRRARDRALPGAGGRGLGERGEGLRGAEWELARAAEDRREVALALVGIDAPPGGERAEARQRLMRRLDELVLASVSRFDVVCEHGPYERLMVVPEESAAS